MQVTHPVANDAVFNCQAVEALYVDWTFTKLVLRHVYEFFTPFDLPEQVTVTVFENGKQRDEHTVPDATGGVTAAINPR